MTEYHVTHFRCPTGNLSGHTPRDLQDALNTFAREGWHLIDTLPVSIGFMLVLEREKPQ